MTPDPLDPRDSKETQEPLEASGRLDKLVHRETLDPWEKLEHLGPLVSKEAQVLLVSRVALALQDMTGEQEERVLQVFRVQLD